MYSQWAIKRRNRIFFLIFLFLCFFGTLFYFVFFSSPPSCFDGIENQDERGVDCGGVCLLVCEKDVLPVRLLWVRAFPIEKGWWSVFAYLENPNQGMSAVLPYTIRLYDRGNFSIAEKTDSIKIYDEVIIPVYWGRVFLEEERPVLRATFDIGEDIEWKKIEREGYKVRTSGQSVGEKNGKGEVRAFLHNDENVPLKRVSVSAILYTRDNNAVTVSETIVRDVPPRGNVPIVFVWQKPFEEEVSRIELIPRVLEDVYK
jgi:hypothetical protein